MVFSSLPFIYLFLPIALCIYFVFPGLKIKNFSLTCFSLLFYSWGEPVWVILLIISAATDFTVGKIIRAYFGTHKAKMALIASFVINIGLLVVFKYSGLLVETFNFITGMSLPSPNITLPIGISFYTFQTLSYSIDVYRGKAKVQDSFVNFLMFVSLFPQLVAGPIIRYTDIDNQIAVREHSFDKFAEGVYRFVFGLSKKIIIANHAGELADRFLMGSGSSTGMVGADVWFGILMFAFQIYFDFSGYSDMAIGLGKMFGFDYIENFNYPYISRSVTEFWRRWHISLGSFFKDYVYIPLGGNRKFQIRNILIVWLLTGIWHGASWNFLLWGLFYGILLIIEKTFLLKVLNKCPIKLIASMFSWLYATLAVMVGWCLFYFTDFGHLFQALTAMFGFRGVFISETAFIALRHNLVFLIVAAFAATPVFNHYVPMLIMRMSKNNVAIESQYSQKIITFNDLDGFWAVLRLFILVALLFICTARLTGESYNPFLYFRF